MKEHCRLVSNNASSGPSVACTDRTLRINMFCGLHLKSALNIRKCPVLKAEQFSCVPTAFSGLYKTAMSQEGAVVSLMGSVTRNLNCWVYWWRQYRALTRGLALVHKQPASVWDEGFPQFLVAPPLRYQAMSDEWFEPGQSILGISVGSVCLVRDELSAPVTAESGNVRMRLPEDTGKTEGGGVVFFSLENNFACFNFSRNVTV